MISAEKRLIWLNDKIERHLKEIEKITNKPMKRRANKKPYPISDNPQAKVEILTKKQLASRLSVCKRQIEILVNEGVIPQINMGRRCVRYDFADVVSALKSNQPQP